MARKAWSFKGVLQNDPCAFCGGPGGTVDHIHPRSKGGPNLWFNYTGACGYCNTRKASSSLLGHLLGSQEIDSSPITEREIMFPSTLFPLHALLGVNYLADGAPNRHPEKVVAATLAL